MGENIASEERIFEVLRSRSRDLAEAILRAIEADEDLALRFASTISKRIAIPLNVATKEDLKVLEATFKAEISRLDQRITTETSAIRAGIKDLRGEISKLRTNVKRISRTIENITISIEEEAGMVVERLLKERGLSISLSPLVLDRKYEFDFYGAGDGFVIVGEARTRASEKTLERLLKRVEKVRDRWPEKFGGRVMIALYCLRYIGDPKKAEEKGVWLIESAGELTKVSIR